MPNAPSIDAVDHPDVECAAIVVAGGSGLRFGGLKQYSEIGGRRVLDFSLDAARATCGWVVLVVPEQCADRPEPVADVVVAGGATRSASVRSGLAVVPENCDIVVVHDAVRPLAGADLFRAVIAAVRGGADAAIPAVDVVDTLRRRDGGAIGFSRDELVAVQTPQAFRASVLRAVHADPAVDATDDASLVSASGGQVEVVPGARTNLKITEPADLAVADVFVSGAGGSGDVEVAARGRPTGSQIAPLSGRDA